MNPVSNVSNTSTQAPSSPGIGSGLNVNGIINKLVAVEAKPLQGLQKQKSHLQDEVGALGKLKSALSTFQGAVQSLNADQLQAHTATSGDKTKFTATADGSAATATYQIGVQRLAEAKQSLSKAFADANSTTIGSAGDKMTLQVGSGSSNSFTVTIGGKTLQGIRDAINNASHNAGVTASILHTNAGYQLVVSSDRTGTANAFTTSFSNSSGGTAADPLSLSATRSAADAKITVNGQTATRSTNTLSDVIQGLTLNLSGTNASGNTTSLTVGNDSSTVKKNIQAFVDAYNKVHKRLDSFKSGALSGDNTPALVRNRMLSVLNTPASGLGGAYSYLAGIGVAIQKDGSMGIDTSRLDAALNSDPRTVAKLFLDKTQGFAARLAAAAGQMAGPGGLVSTETQSIQNDVGQVQNRIDAEQHSLDLKRRSLRKQYTALDSLMGSMKSTQSFLTKQLASLPA